MGTFTQKTDYLLETKSKIKDRLNSLGASITAQTTFRNYLTWLDNLYTALSNKTITGLPDSLEGKCEQSGTPTPTNPVPINTTTGRQEVVVCGKNLLNTLYQHSAGDVATSNGVEFTFNQDGSIKIKRISSNNNNAYVMLYGDLNQYSTTLFTLPSTFKASGGITYPISILGRVKGTGTYQELRIATGGTEYGCILLQVVGGQNVDTTIYPQIEEGTTATTYEEYKGNDYEINLGKNLLPNNQNTLETNGITFTVNDDKSITISGTATANAFFNINQTQQTYVEAGQTYTLSTTTNLPTGVRLILRKGATNGNLITISGGNNKTTATLTTSENSWAFIYVPNETAITTPVTIYPQLEKGDITSYSPYKTPIYLGKIGTYQDCIFKNTQDNPLYDSNLEEGQWYIHKEISRVVLNGSENWNNDGGTQGTDYRHNIYYASRMSIPIAKGTNGTYLSNYFAPRNVVSDSGELGSFYMSNTWLVFVDKNKVYDLENWKTWLSTHPLEVYYILNTPTNTLIEDEELINQLNEIEIFTVISEDFYN